MCSFLAYIEYTNALFDRLWAYRNGYFANVKSGKVLDVKGNKIEHNGMSLHILSLW